MEPKPDSKDPSKPEQTENAPPKTDPSPSEVAEKSEKTEENDGFNINPNLFVNTTNKEIDYNKLISKFGCEHLTPELLERLEKIAKRPLHHLLKRGIFISHRDFGSFLDKVEKGAPVYLYTGRGPSSESLHLGHLLPFIILKYFQEVFQCPTVIQLTDDEKFFYQKEEQNEPLSNFSKYADENAKDIIACGLDPELTFIFKNTDYVGTMYPNIVRLQKALTYNQMKGIFGLNGSENIGKSAFPPIQAAPCISTCFPDTFGSDPKNMAFCLIPHGIDQDPYFRMTRDLSDRLKFPKPFSIHNKFFPGLQGFNTKMSASDESSAIFLTDTGDQIKKKINKYAFSGGKATVEEHRKHGADLEVDIPYNYLKFFLEDDAKLAEIEKKYRSGEMLTGEVKSVLIDVLQNLVKKHQEARKKVTDDVLKAFMKPRMLKKLIPK